MFIECIRECQKGSRLAFVDGVGRVFDVGRRGNREFGRGVGEGRVVGRLVEVRPMMP